MFRRRGNDAPDVLDHDPEPDQGDGGPAAAPPPASPASPSAARPGMTAAKGKPTPKRSEAEKRRRQPYTAPGDRKAAGGQNRDQGRVERQRRMAAARRGEDWALPRKDQGKARALARDIVDARRGISEYYLLGVVVVFALLFLPGLRGKPIINYAILVIVVIVAAEGWWVGRRVMRQIQQRLPGEPTRGVRLYAAMRGTQMRRLRVPAPRVNRGDQV